MVERRSQFLPPGSFVKHLEEQGLASNRSPSEQEGFETHWLNLTSIKIDAGAFVPFLCPPQLSGKTRIELDELMALLPAVKRVGRESPSNIVVLVLGGSLLRLPEGLRTELREHAIGLITKEVLEKVYSRKRVDEKREVLVRALAKSVGVQTLSPYKVGKPAWGGRFFGRERLLQRVLAGKRGASFTFIGNRRVGKTSLLRQIKHRLTMRDARTRTIDIYGSTFNFTVDVLREILSATGSEGIRLVARDGINQLSPTEYPRRVHDLLEAHHVQLAVFVDEVDHLLQFDQLQEWELFGLLRAIEQHDSVRFFFAGFRQTREAKERMDAPLFNFTDDQEVRRLSRDETVGMVREPLELLGIEVASDIPPAIYRETGGQPELVQIFCAEIVEEYAATGRAPDLTALQKKVLGGDFEKKVWGTFMSNSTPYERLACYLLIEEARAGRLQIEDFEFTQRDIDDLLVKGDMELTGPELQALTRNLELGGLIETTPGSGSKRYQFSVPQLGRACEHLDLEFQIQKAHRDIVRERDPRARLLGDQL